MVYEATDMVLQLMELWVEEYYWITVVMMFLIHVGFCTYEVGVSRRKNIGHTLMKNTLLWPTVIITNYLFGWYIYAAWGFWDPAVGFIGPKGLEDPFVATNVPWSPNMGVNLSDHITGVFFAAFLLFSLTTASIVSGAVIERIRIGAFLIFAVLVGSVTWFIDASWGWSPTGWMVPVLGYHDAYASGVVHTIAGFTALAILRQLGPRIGKFDEQGRPREIPLHNQWFATIGLFLIFTGFWGFYAACNIPGLVGVTEGYWGATNIYGNPTTLSGITFNFLLSLAGGFFGGFVFSRGNPFWTYSGGLAGIIAASAGNDLYHPLQAFIIGFAGAMVAYKLHYWVERKFKIDDAVGAVAVHGYAGFFGVVVAGFVLWGTPTGVGDFQGITTPWGNFAGAIIMALLGYVPAYIVAKILKAAGQLRVPPEVEIIGLDVATPYGDLYPYFQPGPSPEIDVVQLKTIAQRSQRSQSDGGALSPWAMTRDMTLADIEWNKRAIEYYAKLAREAKQKEDPIKTLEERIRALEEELRRLKNSGEEKKEPPRKEGGGSA